MDSHTKHIEILVERIEKTGKTTIDLYKYKLLEFTIGIVTSFLARSIVIVTLALFVLVLNIGVSLWLGELLGKLYYGFFVVAGFYLVMGIIFHQFLEKWIEGPVSEGMIKKALK